MSSRDASLYALALRVAEDSDATDRHGAVIAHNGRVLALAANRMCGHPVSSAHGKDTQHAEQRALSRLAAPNRLFGAQGSTCYTARDHDQPNSRPCDMCMGLLAKAGVSRVVYSRNDHTVAVERLRNDNG